MIAQTRLFLCSRLQQLEDLNLAGEISAEVVPPETGIVAVEIVQTVTPAPTLQVARRAALAAGAAGAINVADLFLFCSSFQYGLLIKRDKVGTRKVNKK